RLLAPFAACLEAGPLAGELREPYLLGLVFLGRERVGLAERLAAALEPLDRRQELVAVVAFRWLVRTGRRRRRRGLFAGRVRLRRPRFQHCVLEAAARLVGFRLDPRGV